MRIAMEVSDEMWENSRREFLANLPKDCGLADDKHGLIKKVLEDWDEKSAAERRAMAGGNHVYWHKKYCVIDDRLCYAVEAAAGEDDAEDGLIRVDTDNIKQVSCVSSMFDDIKTVHVASKCHSYSHVA